MYLNEFNKEINFTNNKLNCRYTQQTQKIHTLHQIQYTVAAKNEFGIGEYTQPNLQFFRFRLKRKDVDIFSKACKKINLNHLLEDCDKNTTEIWRNEYNFTNGLQTKSWNNVYETKIRLYYTTITTRSKLESSFRRACNKQRDRICNWNLKIVLALRRHIVMVLKPDTEYSLVIRLFTKSGYNDAAILEFRTDALMNWTIHYWQSVSSCLLLAFIAGFIYLWVTKRKNGTIVFAIFYRDLQSLKKLHANLKVNGSCFRSELFCFRNGLQQKSLRRYISMVTRRRKEYIATQGSNLFHLYKCKM
ncbi:hypothetical protein CVS40_6726 [Lucilia cuprina]|nr:hypothetical protein CVS40_6726 [Lucilia cuprina]